MDFEPLTLRLPPDLVDDLRARAAETDESVGHVIRDILISDQRRRASGKMPNRADDRLVARLQRLLAPDMAAARGWDDIRRSLARHGYVLRPAGGGLTLHCRETGKRLCKSSEIGFAYSRLVRRFGAPMPGHPHRMAHLLKEKAAGAQSPDDQLDLIEPF